MQSTHEVDRNFIVKTQIDRNDVKFYDVKEPPFQIYGVFFENGKFRRLPEEVARSVSDGVYTLHTNTAGGRVRFKTDSSYIAIRAKMPFIPQKAHFALTGTAGFDLYVKDGKEQYSNTFVPPADIRDGYESIGEFGSSKLREITINFPLYSDLSELFIGVEENARILEPEPYTHRTPIVYYGSSITQGGCASRPGNSYESILSRRFDSDYINLGFSGNALAEDSMTEYIQTLDMSVFVYDYDHNAPSIAHLQRTHEKMFQAIRRTHPDLPVIMMSRPKYYLTEEEKTRLDIIQMTYRNARARGDQHVYLIDGKTLMQLAENNGTVDNCHPTDFGFASMAKAVGDVLEQIL